MDGQVALTKLAVKARMPELAPSDALDNIGNERGLIQQGTIAGSAESNTAFGTRLKTAWDTAWPYAGTPLAILLQLYYSLGYTDVGINQQNGLSYSITTPPNADPTTSLVVSTAPNLVTPATPAPPYTKTIPAGNPWFRFDDKTDFCSRFAVVFSSPLPGTWGGGVPPVSELNAIRKIIQQWRNAEATCVGIYVHISGNRWGDGGVWGGALRNWGGSVTVYSP
jgi:hypothetical protein